MRCSMWITILAFAAVWSARAETGNQPPLQMPAFQLADPTGVKHTQAELSERGAVVIVTIPNVKHGPIQDRWARMITAAGWKKDGPRLVFIEDLSQSAVKEKSQENLRLRFVPGKNPLLLIDPDGKTRLKFGIMDDETVIFVIDKTGKTVLFVEGPAEDDVLKKIMTALKKLTPSP